ncbi:bus-12, partial [Pristionchus pacificus]
SVDSAALKVLMRLPPMMQSPAAKSALIFAGASFITGIIAKILITKMFFDYPIVILMLQMATVLFSIELLRVFGVLKLAPYTFDKGRHLFLSSILMSISSWLSVSAYEGIGLPLFDPVKRLTPLLVLGVSTFIYRKQQRLDRNALIALVGISFLSSIAVNFELTMGRFSLFYGLIAGLLHAAAFVQFESLSDTFSPLEMMYMHSFNSLVVFLLADIVQDEIRDAFMYVMTSSSKTFVFLFIFLMVLGLAIQYTTFHCIGTNGALVTSIVANGRAVFQVMFAYYTSSYLFYDLYPGLINWMSFLGTAGSIYYFFQKYDLDQWKPIPFTKC